LVNEARRGQNGKREFMYDEDHCFLIMRLQEECKKQRRERRRRRKGKTARATSSCNIEMNRAGLRHPRILCKARFGAAVYIRQLAVNVGNHEENIDDSIKSVSR